MKVLKKILISLLVITLLIQCSVFVKATENAGYSVLLIPSKTAVSEGESVNVTLVLDNLNVGEDGIGIYIGILEYDSNAFELTSVVGKGDWENPTTREKTTEESSTYKRIAITAETKSGSGHTDRQEVATITLTAIQDSTVGNSAVRTNNFKVSTGDQSIVSTENPDLSVRVKGETITTITSVDGVVTIPGTIDNRTVTDIGSKVVTDIDNVKTIIVPESVVEIADDAFENTEGNIPNSLTMEVKSGSYAESYAKANGIKYEVTDKTIQSIRVVENTLKTSYQVGETLSIAGGQLELTYSDSTKSIISMEKDGVTTSGFDSSLGGTKTITVTYKEKSTTYNVEIVKALASIAVKTIPTKTNYIVGNEIDLTNGVITLTYDDNTTEDLQMITNGNTTEGITISTFDNENIGEQQVTVTYGGKTSTFTIQMGILGDVNRDGTVDITDIMKLKRHILAEMVGETDGDWILPITLSYLGDMDASGELDITDVYQLKVKVLDEM